LFIQECKSDIIKSHLLVVPQIINHLQILVLAIALPLPSFLQARYRIHPLIVPHPTPLLTHHAVAMVAAEAVIELINSHNNPGSIMQSFKKWFFTTELGFFLGILLLAVSLLFVYELLEFQHSTLITSAVLGFLYGISYRGIRKSFQND